MFNWFKKKSKKVYILSYEEIVKRINEGSALGHNSVFFSNAYPSDEANEELKNQGFLVKISSYNNDNPFFQVFWK